MAQFKPAFDFLINNEGQSLFDDKDTGEFSKFGISAKFLVDKGLATEENVKVLIKSLKLDDAAYIYEKYFWAQPKIDRLTHQRVATKVFDFHVNSPYWAIKTLQKCLGTEQDGIIGPKTLGLERSLPASQVVPFLKQFADEQWKIYQKIMEAYPNKRKFAKVWQKRANLF